MSLGTILKDARERKGLTIANVAEQTHLLPLMVEEIEHDDFHRFAAAIYGRGFIRLYAECVGENPKPLVQEFSEIYSGARRPVIATRPVKTVQETPGLVESSTSPSGRPRIKTRVVQTAPEALEPEPAPVPEPVPVPEPAPEPEPVEPAPVPAPVPEEELSEEPAPVPEKEHDIVPEAPEKDEDVERKVPDSDLGVLFNQSSAGEEEDLPEDTVTFKPSSERDSPFRLPFTKAKSKKKPGVAVPFDPFVDEPSPDADETTHRSFLVSMTSFFTTPGGVITGIATVAVLLVVVIAWLVTSVSHGASGEKDHPGKVVVEAFPADAQGRPASFSTRLLPPPDSYVE